MNQIIKVAALCIQDGKLLLVRSCNQEVFFTVGGKIEPGESEEECLIREVKEEVGCGIKSATYFETFRGRTFDDQKDLQLICYLVELDGSPKASSEIAEIHWWNSQSTISLSKMITDKIFPALTKVGALT